jgi:hypothetical protein
MTTPRSDLKVDALTLHHDRNRLSCGVDSLDRHLRTQASQDVRRKANFAGLLRMRQQIIATGKVSR